MLMLLSGPSVYLYIRVDMHTRKCTVLCNGSVFRCCNVDLFAN